MEMENSALMQLMATQTSILEEIRDLRLSEAMREQISTLPTINDTAPTVTNTAPSSTEMMDMQPIETSAMNGPYEGERYYDSLSAAPVSFTPVGVSSPPVPQQMSTTPQNPLSYGNISKVPVVGGVAGMASMGVEDAISYDPSRMSKEATADYFAERSKGFQMGAVEGTGKVVEGVGMASGFLVGGVVGGLAVGGIAAAGTAYIAGEMTGGAEAALNYQDILRKDGYKAFNALESTTEYGGIGIDLDSQQEISSFMRDLATDNFLEDAEMSQILQGSLDNKLLKSVDDVKAFKEKFSKIVTSVKEISLTLNQTIDEAVEFMGEMERRGVSTDKMTGVAATSKVAASFLGIDASEYTNMMLQQSDAIVSGTAMDAESVMEGIGYNAYLISAIEEHSAEGDGVIKQYVKNSGGAAAVSGQMESNLRNFYNAGQGESTVLSLFGAAFEQDDEGNFSINDAKLDEMLTSGKSTRELMDDSQAVFNQMDTTDQAKLARSAGEIFTQNADSTQLLQVAGFVKEQYQELSGVDMDDETALVGAGLAVDDNQARLLDEMITGGTDEAAMYQFDALALKEQMDSARNAQRPGLGTRAKFWIDRNVGNPLGDVGQFISDGVGDVTQDLQMKISGIEDNGRIGGEMIESVDDEMFESLFVGEESNMGQVQSILSDLNPDLEIEKTEGPQEGLLKELSYGQFELLLASAESGELSAAELAELRQDVDAGVYNKDSTQKAEYILNKATGEYDGFFGKFKQANEYGNAITSWGTWASDYDETVGTRESEFSSLEEIQKQQDALKEDISKGKESLNSVLVKGEDLDFDSTQYKELEELVLQGDYKAVSGITKNQEILDIAKEFEDINSRGASVKQASDMFSDSFRQTAGIVSMTSGLYDFVEASGVFSPAEFDAFFEKDLKELKDRAEDDVKDMDKMTDQELADTAQFYMKEGTEIFEGMSDQQQAGLADFLVNQVGSVKAEDLYNEEGTSVDPSKLYEAMMDVSRTQNSDESAAGKSLEGAALTEKAIEAAANHEESVDALVGAFMSEIGKMDRAVADLKTKNYSSYTSVNG